MPLLVGGTGFFLRVLTEPLFREPPLEGGRRAAAAAALDALPGTELERWVRALDPERAGVAVRGGRQRMIRTLLIALLTGRPLSWWHRRDAAGARPLSGVVCLVEVPREGARRADRAARPGDGGGRFRRGSGRADGGGVDARRSRNERGGVPRDGGPSEGRITLEEAVERARVATRQYARRQVTWFRHQLGPGTVKVDGTAPLEAQCAHVARTWRERTARAT